MATIQDDALAAPDDEGPMIGPSDLAGLGWDAGWDAAYAPFVKAGRHPARVVAVHKETAIVRDGTGPDRSATVSGRFRYDALAASDFPAVGDWVALEPTRPEAGPDDPAMIAAVLPRRTAFVRSAADASRRTAGNLADEQVIAANVDMAFLVAGLDGDFNLRRLERYLAVAWSSGVTPVVVLNKADVARDLEDRLAAVTAVAPGVPVVVLSALTGDHLGDLAPHMGPGRTAVVLGSSGVGKSTLVNALLGEERQATATVRDDDSRGRHTTTHRELLACPAARCSSIRPASVRSRWPVPTRGSRPPSTTSTSSQTPVASRTAGTTANPVVPFRPPWRTGR
jgi:ribosome biogenesis GTPase